MSSVYHYLTKIKEVYIVYNIVILIYLLVSFILHTINIVRETHINVTGMAKLTTH